MSAAARSITRITDHTELVSLTTRLRFEAPVLSELIERRLTDSTSDPTALRRRISVQTVVLDSIVYQLVRTTGRSSSGNVRRAEQIQALTLAFTNRAAAVVDSHADEPPGTDAIWNDLRELTNQYEIPLLTALHAFEETEITLANAERDRAGGMIRWAVVMMLAAVTITFTWLAVMARVLIRRFTTPLAILQEGMKRIAVGNLTNPVDPPARDELGDLALMLNHMATELNDSRARLEDYAQNLEIQVAERTYEAEQLAALSQAAAEIAHAAGSILDLEELLHRSVDLIRERFDLIYAGLFLVTPDGNSAELRAASGQNSRELLSTKQTLSLTGTSMIAWAVNNAQARVASDVRTESIRLTHPLLPDTGSEAALPLLSRGEVIGAITVQSEKIDSFTRSKISALQTMAGQIANAISNVRLYRDLQYEKQLAEAANRAKSTFLANMSHEIRTPLNAILGFTEVLQYDSGLTGEQREHIAIIHRSSQSLLTLINGILDLSKIEAGRMTLNEQVFSPLTLIKSLEELFRLHLPDKEINLVFQLAPNLPSVVYGDEGKIRQILVNLLGNALKFTERGQVAVSVRIAQEHEHTDLSPRDYQAPVYLHFAVSDTGVGIHPDEIERLFSPFSHPTTGKTANQGAGLGLAISRQYVQLMGGRLEVNSSQGAGTEISFVVPLSIECGFEIGESEMDEIAHLSPDHPHVRLLVVDASHESRQWMVWLLTLMGFDVRQAANRTEALQVWRFWQPRLTFIDIHQPEDGGGDLAREIRKLPGGENTLITAVIPNSDTIETNNHPPQSIGYDDFLVKPVRANEITEHLRDRLRVTFSHTAGVKPTGPDQLSTTIHHRSPFDLNTLLSAEGVTDFRQAIDKADFDTIQNIIEDIRLIHPAAAERLSRLAGNYDLRGLMALISEPDAPGRSDGVSSQKNDNETFR